MSVPVWRIWNYWECVRVALSKSINLLPFYFVIWNLPQVSCSTLNSTSFQQSSPRGQSCHLVPDKVTSDGMTKQKPRQTLREPLCQSLSFRLRPHTHPSVSNRHHHLHPRTVHKRVNWSRRYMKHSRCPDISLSCLKAALSQRPWGILCVSCDPEAKVEQQEL